MILMVIAALLLGLLFFAYIWNGNWFGKKGASDSNPLRVEGGENLNAQQQVDAVRENMKNLQNKRDQEILNEVNK